MFERFHGNGLVAASLERMIESRRIAQTILLAGPEGVGKATLARRFAARLLSEARPEAAAEIAAKIEQDDLSLPQNRAVIAEREKWPGEKRGEDPLLFSTYPDFVTFCPEGPLRQISIQQMRLVKQRAQLRPLQGQWRVFLIDRLDRAGPQAADSLLKTLEEPPGHLALFLTAENPYDLPPTIRSRSVLFWMTRLSEAEMLAAARDGGWKDAPRRIALADGCPGLAATLDVAQQEKRRGLMVALLEAAAGVQGFAQWVKQSESLLASKSEKLELYIKPLYGLLEDVLVLHSGCGKVRNEDVREALEKIAGRVSFAWLRAAVAMADAFDGLQRRNVQKGAVLDQFVVKLREA